MSKKEIKILTPAGMLGYGFPIDLFKKGIEMSPDVIVIDSGSTDSGPHKLGLGSMTCSREAYYKDLSIMLEAGYENKIPIFISSAGGDGTNAHVDNFIEIIKSISKEKGYRFKIAAIYSDVERNYVVQQIQEGKVTPCGPVEPLIQEEVFAATNIVAQMGVEPYLKVLEENKDINIIISGRTYDPVPFAALGIKEGFDPGLCWHMGKVMECGAICAEPSGKSIMGTLRRDHFVLEPLNPMERCTVYSVSAHTLYEKTHPYILPGPGGLLDLSETKFEQLTDRSVKVSGSKFIPSSIYTVKMEGAKRVGYRSIYIAGVRDSILIGQIENVIAHVKRTVQDYFLDIPSESYQMIFHQFGKNGVMRELEPLKDVVPHELCIILEVAAPTQEIATAICSRARTEMLHCPYEGRMATAGNIALPFTPLEIPLGEVCKFNVYHLLEVENPTDFFPIKYVEVS